MQWLPGLWLLAAAVSTVSLTLPPEVSAAREERVLVPLTAEQTSANSALDYEIREAKTRFERRLSELRDAEPALRAQQNKRYDVRLQEALGPCVARVMPHEQALQKLAAERQAHLRSNYNSRPDWRPPELPGYEQRKAELTRQRDTAQADCEALRRDIEARRDREVSDAVRAEHVAQVQRLELEHNRFLVEAEKRRIHPQVVVRLIEEPPPAPATPPAAPLAASAPAVAKPAPAPQPPAQVVAKAVPPTPLAALPAPVRRPAAPPTKVAVAPPVLPAAPPRSNQATAAPVPQAAPQAKRGLVAEDDGFPAVPWPPKRQAPAAAPAVVQSSSPCAELSAKVDKVVCATPELEQLDREVAQIFARLLAQNAPVAGVLRRNQEDWLEGRADHCPQVDDSCLASLYRARLAALSKEASSGPRAPRQPAGSTQAAAEPALRPAVSGSASPLSADRQPFQNPLAGFAKEWDEHDSEWVYFTNVEQTRFQESDPTRHRFFQVSVSADKGQFFLGLSTGIKSRRRPGTASVVATVDERSAPIPIERYEEYLGAETLDEQPPQGPFNLYFAGNFNDSKAREVFRAMGEGKDVTLRYRLGPEEVLANLTETEKLAILKHIAVYEAAAGVPIPPHPPGGDSLEACQRPYQEAAKTAQTWKWPRYAARVLAAGQRDCAPFASVSREPAAQKVAAAPVAVQATAPAVVPGPAAPVTPVVKPVSVAPASTGVVEAPPVVKPPVVASVSVSVVAASPVPGAKPATTKDFPEGFSALPKSLMGLTAGQVAAVCTGQLYAEVAVTALKKDGPEGDRYVLDESAKATWWRLRAMRSMGAERADALAAEQVDRALPLLASDQDVKRLEPVSAFCAQAQKAMIGLLSTERRAIRDHQAPTSELIHSTMRRLMRDRLASAAVQRS